MSTSPAPSESMLTDQVARILGWENTERGDWICPQGLAYVDPVPTCDEMCTWLRDQGHFLWTDDSLCSTPIIVRLGVGGVGTVHRFSSDSLNGALLRAVLAAAAVTA